MKTHLMLLTIFALLLFGCDGGKNVRPGALPEVTTETPIVCDVRTVSGLDLEIVEFTFVDGVEVTLVPATGPGSSPVRPPEQRWIAMTNDNWERLTRNQNKIVQHTGTLVSVLNYYSSCIKAAQKPNHSTAGASQ